MIRGIYTAAAGLATAQLRLGIVSNNVANASTPGYKQDQLPDEVGRAWHEALTSDRPVVIDALCDPDVPPLPPHITLAQAKAFGLALARGDSDSLGIAIQSFRQKVGELLPHRA